MRCQHFTDKRSVGARASKNTDCPAKLDVVIKRFCDKSKSKVKDSLAKDWPAIIMMKNAHNHVIDAADALKYRPMCQETKEKLLSLFRQGHDPSSALHCLKTDLLLEHGDSYYRIAADGHHVPSASVVHKLFEKQFSTEYGPILDDEMHSNLQKILDGYNASSKGIAKFSRTSDNENYFVVMCSPLMMRAHACIPQTAELVMIDASGGVDKQRHRIYFMITPTAAGGIPIGAIITDSEKEVVFYEALSKLISILPEKSFFGKKFPTVFMTDNDLKERKPLKRLFPDSVLLLCQFHFLKAMWAWLCCPSHEICKTDRQELYHLFKDVVMEKKEDCAIANHEKLLASKTSIKYQNFVAHYLKLWEGKEAWATFLRQGVMLRGNNTTNYVEVVFRVLKDCILNRLMAFNLAQLVDYILTRYEAYMEKRLIDFSNGRYSKAMLRKMLPQKTNETISYSPIENQFGIYDIWNQTKNTKYRVDICSGICSCWDGKTGKLCKHASAIILDLDSVVESTYNLASVATKKMMFFVATGNSAPANWFTTITDLSEKHSVEFQEDVDSQIGSASSSVLEIHEIQETGGNETLTLTEAEEEELESLFHRMKEGVKNNPEIFVPAAQKMIRNASKYACTETGLQSAMHTFASYSGLQSVRHAKKLIRRSHAVRIGVQPTAIGRRKVCLPGKKRVSAGRPRGGKLNRLKDHNYTSFGSLPSRKRKATHNLQDCVFENKSIGSTKQSKK